MCCSRALLRVPARGVDFTIGVLCCGLVVGRRLLFLAGAELGCGAIGMEREKRNAQCGARYMMTGSKDGRRSVGAKSNGESGLAGKKV
jgi:hypothetical protein